jgi:hypothetical protein
MTSVFITGSSDYAFLNMADFQVVNTWVREFAAPVINA